MLSCGYYLSLQDWAAQVIGHPGPSSLLVLHILALANMVMVLIPVRAAVIAVSVLPKVGSGDARKVTQDGTVMHCLLWVFSGVSASADVELCLAAGC